MGPLTKKLMLTALDLLDQKIQLHSASLKISMIMGGGGAMILAHGFPRGTTDIDAIPRGISADVIDPWIKEIAKELNLEPDWLNPHFSSFSHTLPSDYIDRLVTVFGGKNLKVDALGKEEMLIMKCFAHRQKDIPHARALVKDRTNLDIVEKQLNDLKKKKIPGAETALKFLQEILDSTDEEKS